jgi:glycine betaine/proline transport system ATP-binding protein
MHKAEILAQTGCSVGLRNVSLDIRAGEIFVVMGLSGSGKSTLVRHLNRLIDPSSGAVLFDGVDILQFNARSLREFRRRSVSMVFQGFGLLPHRSVLDNVAFGLRARGEPKRPARVAAMRWVEMVGLNGYAEKYPGELSGGMRQRVGLARALAVDTGVVLMDEAFSALDPLIRVEMQDLLLDLQNRLQKTIVFVTHDLDEAVRIGGRIAVMKDGEVVQVGTPGDILDRPANDYVERFVGKKK